MADEDVLLGEWQAADLPAESTSENVPAVIEPETTEVTEPAQVEHVSSDEPVTRESLEREAMDEATLNIALEDLSDKTEVTVADLRRLPDSKDFSDDELVEIAIANGLKIKGYEVAPTAPAKQVVSTAPKAYRVFGPLGKEVPDLAKITARQLLELGRFQYRAEHADQLKTFPELIRLAQLGHHNEKQLAMVAADRAMLQQRVARAEAMVSQAANERGGWIAILSDQTGETFLKAQQKYFEQMARGPAPAGPTKSAAEIQADGVIFYQQRIIPALRKINEDYPTVKFEELDKVAQYLIAQEPLAVMDKNTAWTRLQYLINDQLPHMIEQSGHMRRDAGGERIVPSVATKPGESTVAPMVVPSVGSTGGLSVAERNELLKLRADRANEIRTQSRARLSRAPGLQRVGPEGSVPGNTGTESLERQLDGRSADDARAILRGLKG